MNDTLPRPYDQLWTDLREFIPEGRLIRDPLRTLAYGTDASFYRLTPKLVVEVVDESEVSRLLALAAGHKTPVTFRAAGTSLSGQAITDSVLVRLGSGWRGWRLADGAIRISLQPGVVGGDANRYLAAHGRKIGPDPASIDAAKVGGIAANNASGMCCGVAQNSYQTLHSMRLILADGSVLDTADESSRERFSTSHGALLRELSDLAQATRANTTLADRIRHKFRIKNTTGYSLNALVDFEDPIDVLQHLLIGSEGTLGFIAEITYQTVPEHPCKASALVLFQDVQAASRAVALLKSEPVAAVEMMDRAALHSVEDKPSMPDALRTLPDSAAALLVETRAEDTARLADYVKQLETVLAKADSLYPVNFTDQVEEYTKLWNIRKGLFPSVGAMRATGTTVIIEDVAFPVPRLADGTEDLQALFRKHGYDEAIIFGHALEGNLHFVITQDFGTAAEVERYRRFMDDICRLVVEKYDGSLKAEHSTGRNMAPYVALEWGAEAYELMQKVKLLLDPQGLLNPGVILNSDPHAHIKNLKPLPEVDPLIDKCIECGFCEPSCPSRALTLTPRQRIVSLREMARLEREEPNSTALQRIREQFDYQGVTTCAGDSLCSLACPVDIDTGKMIKVLRGEKLGKRGHGVADWLSRHFRAVASGTRVGLTGASLSQGLLGDKAMSAFTGGVRRLSGNRIPLWTSAMPRAARAPKPRQAANGGSLRVVYFPSCASRTMAPARGDSERDPLPSKVESLLEKAGYEWVYPERLDGLCCGMPFESKGAIPTANRKLRELEAALLAASRGGVDPILYDTSPCTFRTLQNLSADLKICDLTEFIHDKLLPRLQLRAQPGTVAVHPTCSNRKMGTVEKLVAVAEACAERVVLPEGTPCCGWAGDKGFTVPELNASALGELQSQLHGDCTMGVSTSRTCEIGLTHHSGRPYRSVAYLVDACSQRRHS